MVDDSFLCTQVEIDLLSDGHLYGLVTMMSSKVLLIDLLFLNAIRFPETSAEPTIYPGEIGTICCKEVNYNCHMECLILTY